MTEYGVDLAYSSPGSNWTRHNEWRWNRILELVDTKDAIPSPPGDDKWVVDGYKFLLALRAASGDYAAQKRVASRWAALYSAFELRTSADSVTRSAVNAVIAQRNDWQLVADSYGESISTVEWYVKLWWSDFDPASCRPETDLYNSTVQNAAALSPGFTSNNTGAYLLMLAFGYQPDVLWDTLENRELGEDAHRRFMSTFSSILTHKTLRAVTNLQTGSMHAGEIMGQYVELHRIKRELDLEEQRQGGSMNEMLEYCINGARWIIMDRNAVPPELHQPELKLLPASE